MFKTDLMYQCMEGEKQKRMIHVCRKSETTKQNYLKNVIWNKYILIVFISIIDNLLYYTI